jgi:hypothetical protein
MEAVCFFGLAGPDNESQADKISEADSPDTPTPNFESEADNGSPGGRNKGTSAAHSHHADYEESGAHAGEPSVGDQQVFDLIHSESADEPEDLPEAPKTSEGDLTAEFSSSSSEKSNSMAMHGLLPTPPTVTMSLEAVRQMRDGASDGDSQRPSSNTLNDTPPTVTMPFDELKQMLREGNGVVDAEEDLRAALHKKENECKVWKNRAKQLQQRLTEAETMLYEERRLHSAIRDIDLAHPTVQVGVLHV